MKTSKSILGTFLALCILAFFTSCEELLNQAGISVFSNYQKIDVPVDQLPAGEYEFLNFMEPINLDSMMSVSGYQNINKVSLYEANLEITDSLENQNFNAFKSFQVVVSGNDLPEVTIAELAEVPDGVTKINLNIIDIDLLQYMHGVNYELKIRGVLEEDLNSPMVIIGSVRYKVGLGF